MNYQLEPLGITYQKLKEQTFIHPPHEYRKFERNGFRTPSKKLELYCRTLERMGYDPLPTYKEPPESPVNTPELARNFLTYLPQVVGGRSFSRANTGRYRR